jgi:hypothetical protein
MTTESVKVTGEVGGWWNSPRWLWLAPVVSLFPALLACFKVMNRDIGFHVATGRAMELLGEVPRTNVLSFTVPDQPWILHQWIPAWLFYQVDERFGPAGLVVVKMVLVYLAFNLLWVALWRRWPSLPVALFWFAVAVSAGFTRFYIRPFLFTVCTLALMLLGVTRFPRTPSGWKDFRGFFLVTLAAVGLGAALHLGFVYSWMAALAIGVGVWVEPLYTHGVRLFRDGGAPVRRQMWAVLVWGLGMFLVPLLVIWLVHPTGLALLSLPDAFSNDPYLHEHLVEYRPPAFSFEFFPGLWWGLSAAWGITLISLFLDLRGKRLAASTVAAAVALALFSHLVLKHQRVMLVFGVAVAFFLVVPTGRLLQRIRWPVVGHALGVGLVVACLLLSARTFALWKDNTQFGFGLDSSQYPEALFAFVEENDLPERAYVSDSWGGWWLWEYYPRRKVFYDNRLEAYPSKFFREEYQAIRYAEAGWREKLDSYQVDMVVMRYSTLEERDFRNGKPSVRETLLLEPDWQLVYWDDLGEVFLRRSVVPASCGRCLDLRHYEPDTQRSKTVDIPALAEELRQVIRHSGPSVRAYKALLRTLKALGLDEEAKREADVAREHFPQYRWGAGRKSCGAPAGQ